MIFNRQDLLHMSYLLSSFEIVSVDAEVPKVSFQIAKSVADTDTVNPNSIKSLFADGLSTFSLKANKFLVIVQVVCPQILLTVQSSRNRKAF